MERKLASVQTITEILPIEGADTIEVAVINGWKVVVKKGEYVQGQRCIYCEIDSFLPIKEEFEFLRKSSYKKMGDREGFRLRTIKLRGQVSQGLVLPFSLVDEPGIIFLDGDDVSDKLDIVKYEPPIPAELAGKVKGYFPSFIRKTDEERVQNVKQSEYTSWISNGIEFYASEKLDGSSATYFVKDGEFGVCSRNLELSEPEPSIPGMAMREDGIERPKRENTFWKIAYEMGIREKMLIRGGSFALQGELIGEGVQGNPYKIKGHTVRFFNAFDIDKQERMGLEDFLSLLRELDFESVPIMSSFVLPTTIEEMLKAAEGKSVLNPKTEREGLVIRSKDAKISFKAISNKFLLNKDE